MTNGVEFEVPHNPEGRADKVLAKAFPDSSRSLIKRAIENGKIHRLDGSVFEPKTKLKRGFSTRKLEKLLQSFGIEISLLKNYFLMSMYH